MEKIKLINDDCMNVMNKYDDNYFDLAIVDPPYGIGDFNSSKSKHKKVNWNNKIPDKKYFKELERVSKHQIIWGANYYQNFIKSTGRIIHDKTGGGAKKFPASLSEGDIASHSFGVTIKVFHYVSNGNVIGNKIDWENNLRWHPCQKPVKLYQWLLENYSKKEDRILDTHLGSGSSAIASYYFGVKEFVGIELDKEYFETMKKRFKQHTKQIKLF
jgi:site-specific DNA-methyltransferase (adenine-specific)